MRHLKTFAKAVISIGLFTYLIVSADHKQIIQVLSNVYKVDGLTYLFLAFLAGLTSILLMALRWRIILKNYNLDFSLKKLLGFYLVGLFFVNPVGAANFDTPFAGINSVLGQKHGTIVPQLGNNR